ncbi:hypothetical protein OC25_17675 [Pedobacter kyungheensis]|uniref:Uncharacterized protein n=1 Tax=Pedobacter kyungheensis TaxID=1069985 RepID=A0A0C1FKC6_9SPHI|nr:hypothetical protein [Pedobacter kyungheensis]KIA92263.1 hypothetical protein OC25_17675 [Pedobacter kyungheensis]
METKVKENGQANVNSVKAEKTPRFVAGNPVNEVAKKAEVKNGEEAEKPEEVKEQLKTEPSKLEIKEALAQQKPALNLDEMLKLVADLSKRTALRDRYKGYIDALAGFEQEQKENVDELEDETAFQGCELEISDSHGNVFSTKSPSVIKGTIAFISGRLAERLAEVEAGIVLPA